MEERYGGTSPEAIAKGTQQLMDQRRSELPPQIQIALNLYQQLQQWNHRLDAMDVLQQSKLPPQELEGARRAKEDLDRLLEENSISEQDLHNLLQLMTWDASADAKAARAMTGDMPKDIQKRVEKGCELVAQAVLANPNGGTCLDVGCGFGVLVPFLKKVGIPEKQIYGVDLSPEMIRNAKEMYVNANFAAANFFQYEPPNGERFDAVIFCAALHDLPDMMGALEKVSKELLADGGTLVILHPQGASHVLNQVRSNPVLVQRGLPTTEELKGLGGLELVTEPVSANSRQDKDGYLAVLQKK